MTSNDVSIILVIDTCEGDSGTLMKKLFLLHIAPFKDCTVAKNC